MASLGFPLVVAEKSFGSHRLSALPTRRTFGPEPIGRRWRICLAPSGCGGLRATWRLTGNPVLNTSRGGLECAGSPRGRGDYSADSDGKSPGKLRRGGGRRLKKRLTLQIEKDMSSEWVRTRDLVQEFDALTGRFSVKVTAFVEGS